MHSSQRLCNKSLPNTPYWCVFCVFHFLDLSVITTSCGRQAEKEKWVKKERNVREEISKWACDYKRILNSKAKYQVYHEEQGTHA